MIQWFRLFVHKGGRHTDTYFIALKKSFFCHKNDRLYVHVHVYIQVGNFLKSHDNLLGITYRIKIMLNGITIIKQRKTPFISIFVQLHFIK